MAKITDLTKTKNKKDWYTVKVKTSQYEIIQALAEYCGITSIRATELMLDVASEVVLSRYRAMIDIDRMKEWAKEDTIAEDIEWQRHKKVKDGKEKTDKEG